MSTILIRILATLGLALFALSGCAGLSLKATPIQESIQLETVLASDSELKADEQGLYPFNHAWSAGYCAPELETAVYITPIDTSRLDPSKLQSTFLDSEDLSSLADYARKSLEGAFSERQSNFHVVEQPPAHGRVVELSVVELSGTEVARNVMGAALGAFVPGGNLISIGSSGAIGVEGVVRDAETKKPLFVFADRERGKIAPFSFNDFRLLSHARVAIDDWSEQLVESCVAAPGTRVADSSPVTLLPL